MSQRYNFEQIRDDFMKELANEKIYENLYGSLNNICRIFIAILDTNGEDWAEKLIETGVFTKEEGDIYTKTFQPYIESIIDYFSDRMSGGSQLDDIKKKYNETMESIKDKSEKEVLTKSVEFTTYVDGLLNKLSSEEKKEAEKLKVSFFENIKKKVTPSQFVSISETQAIQNQMKDEKGKKRPIRQNQEKKQDKRTGILECHNKNKDPEEFKKCIEQFVKPKIDEKGQTDASLFKSIQGKLGSINQTVDKYASRYGILKLEKESDFEGDVELIPELLKVLIASGLSFFGVIPKLTLKVLNQIKVPFRLIVVCVYLGLDVARLAINATGNVKGREIMSIVLAFFELLRGNWKQSILSIMGYFGSSPLLIGELGKAYLFLFQSLDPEIQKNIISGSLDASKSLIVGILLAIVKVVMPDTFRFPMMNALNDMAKDAQKIEGAEGVPGKQSLKPSWNDLNNLQSHLSDTKYTCSQEFREAVKENEDFVTSMILKLLRIDVEPSDCKNKNDGTFYTFNELVKMEKDERTAAASAAPAAASGASNASVNLDATPPHSAAAP